MPTLCRDGPEKFDNSFKTVRLGVGCSIPSMPDKYVIHVSNQMKGEYHHCGMWNRPGLHLQSIHNCDSCDVFV